VSAEDLKPLILPGSVIALMAAWMVPIAIRATGRRRRRVRALTSLADRLGLSFRRGPDPRGERELPGFEGDLVQPGMDTQDTIDGSLRIAERSFEVRLGDCRSRLERNLTGNDPLAAAMADPKESQSYVAVRLPTIVIPDVVIAPRAAGPSLDATLGLETVRFESDAFNRAFSVATSRPRFAYDILQPQAMELLMRECPSRIRIGRGWCLARSDQHPWNPDQMEMVVSFLARFVATWPAFVMEDLEAMAPRKAHR
jgi:hypothetical protein